MNRSNQPKILSNFFKERKKNGHADKNTRKNDEFTRMKCTWKWNIEKKSIKCATLKQDNWQTCCRWESVLIELKRDQTIRSWHDNNTIWWVELVQNECASRNTTCVISDLKFDSHIVTTLMDALIIHCAWLMTIVKEQVLSVAHSAHFHSPVAVQLECSWSSNPVAFLLCRCHDARPDPWNS